MRYSEAMLQGRVAQLVEETETASGWRFRFELDAAVAAVPAFEITVSWQDHEDIAGGGVPPSELAEAAAQTLVEFWTDSDQRAQTPPERIDLSTARRLIPGFVEGVRSRLVR
jgi:hypothetical protein